MNTECCIVGGGPGGMILAYYLSSRGIPTTLLEMHGDFDRDFRGDTLHASSLEIIEELGLIDGLLALPHTKEDSLSLQTPNGRITMADFSLLKTKYPYVMVMPQSRFLDYVAGRAKKFSTFRLITGAKVEALIIDNGNVSGVRYQTPTGTEQLNAPLTIGADGRFSTVRKLAGIVPKSQAPPIDVLWFRVPRHPEDPKGIFFKMGPSGFLIFLDRTDEWQCGYILLKGEYQKIHAAGLEALKKSFQKITPEFSNRFDALTDWKQVSLLSVELSRVPKWYKPGLLLIGDAAHVMSPVGGVGINYAIQDAIAAGNALIPSLKNGNVSLEDLAKVQKARQFPTIVIQTFQALAQNGLAKAIRPNQPFKIPTIMKIGLNFPFLRPWITRLIAYGWNPVHVQQ